jgi:hypothetical protein
MELTKYFVEEIPRREFLERGLMGGVAVAA